MRKKYLVELLGTFILALIVRLSVAGEFVVPTPILAALTLALFVYSVGHISGAHFNPAVTLGLLSIRKISLRNALPYIGVQFVGAMLAIWVSNLLGVKLTPVSSNYFISGLAEGMGMFCFTFGIAAVVAGRVEKAMSGAVVGGSLLLGIALAALTGSVGILNPAVALAVQIFTPIYIVGPIIGSILGFNVYGFLNRPQVKR